MKPKIAIVAGGYTSEHDVSLRSAAGIESFLDKQKYDVTIVRLEKDDYKALTVGLHVGQNISRDAVMAQLINIQYDRNDFDLKRGTFRCRGDVLDIFTPDSEDMLTRISFFGDCSSEDAVSFSMLWMGEVFRA